MSPFTDEVFCRPVVYKPILVDGVYRDTFVNLNFRDGIKCPCMATGQKVWQNLSGFKTHTKCAKHQSWLMELNRNAADIYSRYVELQELADQRAQINTRLENELAVYKLRCEMLERHIRDIQSLTQNMPMMTID